MDEFDIIENYFQNIAKNNPYALNLNDDVFFDKIKGLVVSIDTYNQGIHYINFKYPDLVIKKIIRSSISDLICKGVKPKYIFLSGSGNNKIFNKKNLKLISKSILQEQKKFNFKLSGGDTVFSSKGSFTVTVIGYSKNIVKRNKAKNNDDIYVTGNLGDSYIGLKILQKKIKLSDKLNKYFVKKYYLPILPYNLQNELLKYANSSIDISDGLFSDLKKLINKQSLGFKIYLNLIPVSQNMKSIIKDKNLNFLNYVSRGDDYQILFTASKKNRIKIRKLSKRINLKISHIGEITNQSRDNKIVIDNKPLKSSKYRGYSHIF